MEIIKLPRIIIIEILKKYIEIENSNEIYFYLYFIAKISLVSKDFQQNILKIAFNQVAFKDEDELILTVSLLVRGFKFKNIYYQKSQKSTEIQTSPSLIELISKLLSYINGDDNDSIESHSNISSDTMIIVKKTNDRENIHQLIIDYKMVLNNLNRENCSLLIEKMNSSGKLQRLLNYFYSRKDSYSGLIITDCGRIKDLGDTLLRHHLTRLQFESKNNLHKDNEWLNFTASNLLYLDITIPSMTFQEYKYLLESNLQLKSLEIHARINNRENSVILDCLSDHPNLTELALYRIYMETEYNLIRFINRNSLIKTLTIGMEKSSYRTTTTTTLISNQSLEHIDLVYSLEKLWTCNSNLAYMNIASLSTAISKSIIQYHSNLSILKVGFVNTDLPDLITIINLNSTKLISLTLKYQRKQIGTYKDFDQSLLTALINNVHIQHVKLKNFSEFFTIQFIKQSKWHPSIRSLYLDIPEQLHTSYIISNLSNHPIVTALTLNDKRYHHSLDDLFKIININQSLRKITYKNTKFSPEYNVEFSKFTQLIKKYYQNHSNPIPMNNITYRTNQFNCHGSSLWKYCNPTSFFSK
ncbi:ankyrin repeat-containing protein [Tieghemostelium lacteum]|uniref:Ankyrin repeat-containing protein n=1 Tax=Tieghemostelium lacteum TaxID=361077 RepID=A0A152A4J1_TIELA|nr:ankyrin repeat-containing protein [Tieghemostelium lacteum]|eukprot:KYR00995.1 ankyrin repeat-containing protein [Tieghemostelium lacteum]